MPSSATSTGNLSWSCKNIQGQSAGNEQSQWLYYVLKHNLWRLMIPTCYWACIYFWQEVVLPEEKSFCTSAWSLTPSELISSAHPAVTASQFRHTSAHAIYSTLYTVRSGSRIAGRQQPPRCHPKPIISKAVLTNFGECSRAGFTTSQWD